MRVSSQNENQSSGSQRRKETDNLGGTEVTMKTKSLFIQCDGKQKYTETALNHPLATELRTRGSSE